MLEAGGRFISPLNHALEIIDTDVREKAPLQYCLARRLNRLGLAKRKGNGLMIDMWKRGVDRLYLQRAIEPEVHDEGLHVGLP